MDKKKIYEQTHIINQAEILPKRKEGEEDACLVIMYGSEYTVGNKIQLPKQGTVVIGRSTDAHIQLNSYGVSRSHASITAGKGGYYIRDLNSTNGTFVNEVQIGSHPVRLSNGDRIQMGTVILKFLLGNDIEMQYHEEIYKLATTDGMLMIPNRRYLMDYIEKEISRSKRHRRNLSLIMFDIDFFKRINDTYGHLAGDAVLKEIVDRIRHRIRREDTFARYGGEEFVILMPEIPLSNAIFVGEKVRGIVAERKFSYMGKDIFVTISVGVAAWTPDITTPEEFIAVADRRLYIAKQTGRNKVVAHD